jgi:hypothetical protein
VGDILYFLMGAKKRLCLGSAQKLAMYQEISVEEE